MVVATPQSLEAASVDQWFHAQADALMLRSPLPELARVQDTLRHHLPERVQRLSRHVPQPQNASSWLKIVLKSGELIRLWSVPDQPVTVAVNCSGNLKLAQEQLELIQSPEFSATRRELGIDKHWFLAIPGYPLQTPKQSELLDAFYAQLAKESECDVVEFGDWH
ncbi:MAG: hypothetical protein HC851_19200 [Acaryochloris sp. RU_4_1]|nr:hypothetical protein [Acaryochloris sp. RU_4_1]